MNNNNLPLTLDSNIVEQIGTTLVTGGAGFIGSHVADALTFNNVQVKILDNLSTGRLSNLAKSRSTKLLKFIKGDLKNSEQLKIALKNITTVFHIAANPEVRSGFEKPRPAYDQNIKNTFQLLEAIRKSKVECVIFSSSSTIYGEPDLIPTPENFGPLKPISIYGASKLACEALLSSFCHSYGFKTLIFRFANVVGSRGRHGVIVDFINKLRMNSNKLEILGDGKQSKSYIHVSDCVNGFFTALSKSTDKLDIFNVGNDDKIDVMSIARIVCRNMGLQNVKLIPTGGTRDGGGWVGDVKTMQLNAARLKALGWKPNFSSSESVDLACKELLQELAGQ